MMATTNLMETNKKKEGIVVKGIGGFYYVKVDDAIIESKGKGLLKKDGFVLAVGDKVTLNFDDESTPVIELVEDRKNAFIRPPIANVDGIIVVLAAANPIPNFNTIDKLIIMAEKNDIDIAICINKVDLVTDEEIKAITNLYENIYPVYLVSGINNRGIRQLMEFAKGKKIAFAGASGVGKSTLINCLKDEQLMETGEVSKKTSRGKHTTRHVEIFSLENGGMIYDTPGFSSYELFDIEPETLVHYYPDVYQFSSHCRYDNCRHIKEPECQVRQAVRDGKLNKTRYLSYKNNYLELMDRRKY